MSSNPDTKASRCSRAKWCWRIPFIILGVVAIKSALTLVLWNWLIPELFHGPTITLCQAFGLVVLAKVLVGFGRPGGGHGRCGPPWKRWDGLSPEDREKVKEELSKKS